MQRKSNLIVSEQRIFAKKSLGQNFLSDKNVLRDIVKVSQISAAQTIIEVGPGTGNLTEYLLETGAKVIAIEKDTSLIPVLEKRFHGIKNLQIVHNDILTWKDRIFLDNYSVIANIPYYITSPILKLFLEDSNILPNRIVVLVQKEFAEKAVLKPPRASGLAMYLNTFGEVHIARTVEKHYFSPVPKVDSAVLVISPNQKPDPAFLRFLHMGFMQPRKKLRNVIGSLLKNPPEAQMQRRAEELTLDEWKTLFLTSN